MVQSGQTSDDFDFPSSNLTNESEEEVHQIIQEDSKCMINYVGNSADLSDGTC